MTLPALGVIGLTFLCLLLISGLVFLILYVNKNLRYRICEVLASYRSPPSQKKIEKQNQKKQKKWNARGGFEDMYSNSSSGSYPPQPMELQTHSVYSVGPQEDPTHRHSNHQRHPQLHHQEVGKVIASNASNQYASNQHPLSHRQAHSNHNQLPPTQHSIHNEHHHHHSHHPRKARRTGSGEYLMYPNSSGTASPADSAIGTMEPAAGKSLHGILKNSTSSSHQAGHGRDSNRKSGDRSKTKSVVYEDQVDMIEIS